MRSIVRIARDLGKRTVAEFVSDPQILEVCRDEGVDFAQGYLIGKPVAYDEFVAAHLPSGTTTSPKT
jgi:EAL domain-containing protein (putative c-di-GMP-specific phosphodiesterase class I)